MLSERGGSPPDQDEWRHLLNEDVLTRILRTAVMERANAISVRNCQAIAAVPSHEETREQLQRRQEMLRANSRQSVRKLIDDEASIAGVLAVLAQDGRIRDLEEIFFTGLDVDAKAAFYRILERAESDPYLTFDPRKGVDSVSLSPLGVVHLFRQYFFELDTFLGSPTGHVWLSPGATVSWTLKSRAFRAWSGERLSTLGEGVAPNVVPVGA